MIKILMILFCCVSGLRAYRPGRFVREETANQFLHRNLINMTESLCKDTMYKLRQAYMIQELYSKTYGYELGIITAEIMDRYKHMIKVYRYYSNARAFKNENHSVQKILNAYAIIQSDYNQIRAETVLFYNTLRSHKTKETSDREIAKGLALKYNMSVAAVLALMRKGIRPEEFDTMAGGKKARRSNSKTDRLTDLPEEMQVRKFLTEDPMAKNINTWTPIKSENNTEEEEYKRKLRYIMWAEKWNGFDGETEGVNIPNTIAKLGHANASNFLLKELKGAV